MTKEIQINDKVRYGGTFIAELKSVELCVFMFEIRIGFGL